VRNGPLGIKIVITWVEDNCFLSLFLLSFKKCEAHRVPRQKACGARRRRIHHGCGAHLPCKFFFKVHVFQSIFWVSKLDKMYYKSD